MIKNLGSKGWAKEDTNIYRKGQFTIVREGKVWVCRFNGKRFDEAKTLVAAKGLCE